MPSEYEHRHSRGREIGVTLDCILDSIERLVLPADPSAAFDLLVKLFEADTMAIESCWDHDWEVARAFKRAADVMAAAARHLPQANVRARIDQVLRADRHGVRLVLQ